MLFRSHPSGMGPRTLENFPHIDYAIAGEGEKSLPQLVDVLEDKGLDKGFKPLAPSLADNLKGIPGLVYKGMNPGDYSPPCFESDVDKLDFPAWDMHPPRDYPFAPQGAMFRQFPFAPIIITRGCPFPCTFCAGHTLAGRKFRKRSVEHVIEEMSMLYDTYGVREFHILDDNFSLEKDYLMSWCESVRENFVHGISWCAPNGLRLDTLDPEAVRAMKASGCYYVSVGIESGSDRILKHMRKGFTVDDVREKVGMIRKEGLDVNGFFILGYPEETAGDMEATIKLSLELDLSRAAYFNFLPLPGTPIFDEMYPEGLQNGIWDSFFQYNAPFAPKGMTSEDIKKFQRDAHMRFYFRPKILWRIIRELRSIRQVYWIFRRASKVFGAGADILKTHEDR